MMRKSYLEVPPLRSRSHEKHDALPGTELCLNGCYIDGRPREQ